MDEPPVEPPPESRIPFSPGYLAVVVAVACLNALFFVVLARQLQDPNNPIAPDRSFATRAILGVCFGLLFAAACNLSALALARWLGRKHVADLVLLFLVVEAAGLALCALAAPYLVEVLHSTAGSS